MPQLHLFRLPVGQAYLWRDADGSSTLVDAGSPGTAEELTEAMRSVGVPPDGLDRIVLTHLHEDHAGGAAELAAGYRASVLAHHLEAPVIRGELPPPWPDFTDAPQWERELFAQVHGPHGLTVERPALRPAPPCRVDHELKDGDLLDFGEGARVLHVPGHTDGSLALHLPTHGVLFTGDTMARTADGVVPGVFNLHRPELLASVRRLEALGAQTVCFGHGDPLLDAGTEQADDADGTAQ